MQQNGPNALVWICFLVAIIVSASYFKLQIAAGKNTSLAAIVSDLTNGQLGQSDVMEKKTHTLSAVSLAQLQEGQEPPAESASPINYLAGVIRQKFASSFIDNNLTDGIYAPDSLWWRSEKEGYRILVKNARTYGVQQVVGKTLSTTDDIKPGITTHPASKNVHLAKIIKEIKNLFKELGYKESKFSQCPVSQAYDPYNNCVAIFTKGQQYCSLLVGFGRLDRQPDLRSYERLELSCSDAYQAAYQQAAAYLRVLNLVNPTWRVPDMAVYEVHSLNGWSRVSFGAQSGIYYQSAEGLQLLGGGSAPLSCALVETWQVPQTIYQECL